MKFVLDGPNPVVLADMESANTEELEAASSIFDALMSGRCPSCKESLEDCAAYEGPFKCKFLEVSA